MDRGLVSPDWQPLVKLIDSILRQVRNDLIEFDPVYVAVTIGLALAGGVTLGEWFTGRLRRPVIRSADRSLSGAGR